MDSETLKNILLKCFNVKNCELSYESGDDEEKEKKGQNFLGLVKKATVTGYTDSNALVVRKIFVKTLTESEERNERLKLKVKFSREGFVYEEIIPAFEILQKDTEKLHFAKCHSASEAHLILEDVSERGFKDISHLKPLECIEHVSLMIKDLAKWHSLSFALRSKDPLKYKYLTRDLDTIFVTKDRAKLVYEKAWNKALDAIKDKNIKQSLERIKEKMIDEATSPPLCEKYAVICHGDLNMRNVLFKYNKENYPEKMIMIDFQLSHLSSPVTDLTFLIFSSTSAKFRADRYPKLLEMYYESLDTHLKHFGMCIDQCYPRDTMDEDHLKYLAYNLTTLFTVTRVMCANILPQEELNQVYKPHGGGSIFDCYSDAAEKEYAVRINGIVEDFLRYGYIR